MGREAVALRAAGLVKAYRAPSGTPIPVLAGVDLEVRAGELVVIQGASGSGKSTLLNVVGLLEEADAGEIWFGHAPVSRLSRAGKAQQRGRFVGFVFQSFLLLPSLTSLENVLLAARYAGGTDPGTRRWALSLMEMFGVLDRRDHYPPQLSGGEQQRVAFCRAVLNDPLLLLADEPTGNLDDDHSRMIFDALRTRARDGRAVVVVSHRTEALEGATAAYRLQNGRLAKGPLAKEEIS